MLVLPLLLALQADPSALVEKLRSERIEERDQASRGIEELGRKAAPALEKAAKDSDVELAERARFLLRLLELRETLPPRLLRVVPGIERRLATGDDADWTQAFLDATGLDPQRFRARSGLADEDVAPLADRALRGASSTKEALAVIDAAADRRLAAAVPGIVRRLDPPETRLQALYALGMIGGPEALRALRACLRNPDPDTRSNAAMALRPIATRECLNDLLPLLQEERARPGVLWCIKQIGSTDAVPALLDLCAKVPPLSKPFVAGILGHLGAREALPLLRPLLADQNYDIRNNALQALMEFDGALAIPELLRAQGRFPDYVGDGFISNLLDLEADAALPLIVDSVRRADRVYLGDSWGAHPFVQRKAAELVPQLAPILSSRSGNARAAAANILAGLHRKELAPALRALIADPDPRVRYRAALACGDLGDQDAAPAIRRLLEDPDPDAREGAILAAWRLRDEAAIPQLLGFLDSPIDDEARAAALAVGGIGSAKTKKTLGRLLRHEDTEPATQAALSLCRLNAHDALPGIVDLLSRADGFQSPRLAEALRALDSPDTVPTIARLLGGPLDDSNRWACVRGLARLRQPEAAALLRKIASSGEITCRYFALEALAATGSHQALEAALAGLKDPEPTFRQTALRVLGRLHAVDRDGDVAALVSDPEYYVRAEAAETLGRLGATKRLADLETLLLDCAPPVRLAAAQALLELGSRRGADPFFRAQISGRGDKPYYLRLNALRNPEAWKRLETRFLEQDLPLTTAEILKWLPRETGLPIIHTPAIGENDQTWIRGWGVSPIVPKGTRLLEALETVLEGSACEVILEKDGLRYLHWMKAAEFWIDWWAKEKR